jgi:hypothetical protein
MQVMIATITIRGNGSLVPVYGSHQGPESETAIMRIRDTNLTFLCRTGSGGEAISSDVERLDFCRRRNTKNVIQHKPVAIRKAVSQ